MHLEYSVSDPDSIKSVGPDSESGRRSGSRRAKNVPQKYVKVKKFYVSKFLVTQNPGSGLDLDPNRYST